MIPLALPAVILLFVVAGLLQPFILNRSGARINRALPDVQRIRHHHVAAGAYLVDHGSVAASWLVLNAMGYLVPEMYYSSSSNSGHFNWREELAIGDYGVEQIWQQGVTLVELEDEIAKDPPAGVWERMGEIVMSREEAAYTSGRSDLVAGYLLYAGERFDVRGDGKSAFVFADGSARYVRVLPKSQQYEGLVAADRAARKELGLSEPPDYAAVIQEYVEKQKKR